MPSQTDEQAAVVAEVGGPPVLRVVHERVQIGDHGVEIESLELRGIVERFAHRVGARGVLVEPFQAQIVGPPVAVVSLASTMRHRAFACGIVCHVCLQSVWLELAGTARTAWDRCSCGSEAPQPAICKIDCLNSFDQLSLSDWVSPAAMVAWRVIA